MNNCFTISQLSELDVQVVFYSDLLINPKKELSNIVNKLNLIDFPLNTINFRKPSQTNVGDELINNPEKQLNKNFNEIDKKSQDCIQKIFDHFDFKLYNAYSPLPNKRMLGLSDLT